MPEEAAQEPVVEADPVEGTPVEAAVEAPVEVSAAPDTFTVKVDGEDVAVTLEEALKGYQRQSDYTRKTQDLAQQREQLSHAERLWNAIEANPEATLRQIAVAYGIDLTPAQAQAIADGTDPFESAFEEPKAVPQDDPRLAAVEEFMRTAQEREVQAEIEREIAAVRTKYAVPNLDAEQLLEYAVDNNIGSLDAAFRAMSWEAVQQQAARGRKQQAKADAPPVAGGHPVQAGAVVPGQGSQFPSMEEAFAIAETTATS